MNLKMIYVSGDDYAALEFERYFNGESVKTIIERLFDNGEEHDGNFDVELYNFLMIPDDRFIEFIRNEIQDYDDAKHRNFYFEGETIN